MKNVNNLTINVKFPYLNKEKKSYLSFVKKRNSKYNYYHYNEKFQIKTINPFKSANLINPITPFYGKNKILKSFSSNNLYITKLPNEEKKKLKDNASIENFCLQIIPPNKNKIIRLRKAKEKKIKYKELKYVGDLLGIEEKKDDKNEERKLGIPLESRKDYFNFIRHKRNLFFNPNATSNYVHERSSNYLISTITKSKTYSVINNNNLKPKDQTEELLELRDQVPNFAFESEKMMKQIKSLFSQDFKFNNMQFNEDFYKNNENRINFMEDIYKVPVIKNNLVGIKIDKNKSLGMNEWKNINVINHQTWNFLNQLKRKIQREKDEKAKKLEEYLKKKREAEKEYEILEKKNYGKNLDKKDEKDTLKEKEKLKNIMDDIINLEEKKEQKFEDLYIIEEYFLHKNTYFDDKVSIASKRLRHVFFDNNKNDEQNL